MSDQSHTYSGPAYLVRLDPDRRGASYVKLSAYSVDTYFRLKWLPRMLETDLIVTMVKEGDFWPAIYHPGAASYTAEAVAHLAGLASTVLSKQSSTPAENRYAAMRATDLTRKLIDDYNQIRHYPTKGYYVGKQLVWEGRALKSELRTESQFRNLMIQHGWTF